MSEDLDMAYKAMLKRASQQEEMDKEAAMAAAKALGTGLYRGGAALASRVGASVRAVPNDYKQMAGFFKNNPNAVSDARRAGQAMSDATGGITRMRSATMANSARRFNDFVGMSDDAYKTLGKNTSNLGKIWNPLSQASRQAASHRKLLKNDKYSAAMNRARKNLAAGRSRAQVQREFMEDTFSHNFTTPAERSKAIIRHGMKGADGSWGKADWIGDTIGNHAGHYVGAAGVFAPATFAPWTMAEWGGAASAAPSAAEYGMQGGLAGGADRMHYLNQLPFHERMRHAYNPDRNLAHMYLSDPERSGQAYNHMYGPGKLQHIKTPGVGDMFKDLANPFFSNETYLDKMIRAKSQQQFQKMGNHMTEAEMEKEAMQLANKGWQLAKGGYNGVKGMFKKKPDLPFVAKQGPAIHRTHGTPNPIGAGRMGNLWHQVKNNKMLAFGTASALGTIPLSFMGGRRQVQEGAYNSGYGAGHAFATKKHADLPMWQRMGAGVSPDLTLNFLKNKYPEFYKTYANRHLPAGMR